MNWEDFSESEELEEQTTQDITSIELEPVSCVRNIPNLNVSNLSDKAKKLKKLYKNKQNTAFNSDKNFHYTPMDLNKDLNRPCLVDLVSLALTVINNLKDSLSLSITDKIYILLENFKHYQRKVIATISLSTTPFNDKFLSFLNSLANVLKQEYDIKTETFSSYLTKEFKDFVIKQNTNCFLFSTFEFSNPEEFFNMLNSQEVGAFNERILYVAKSLTIFSFLKCARLTELYFAYSGAFALTLIGKNNPTSSSTNSEEKSSFLKKDLIFDLNSIRPESLPYDKRSERKVLIKLESSVLKTKYLESLTKEKLFSIEILYTNFYKSPRSVVVKDYFWLKEPEFKNFLIFKKEEILKLDKKNRLALEKGAMKNFAYMEKYSKSLQGGKIVLRDIILKKKTEEKTKTNSKNKGKSKKADLIKKTVEENQRKKGLEKMDLFIKMLSKEKNVIKRINKLDAYLSNIAEPTISLEGQFKLISWCLHEIENGLVFEQQKDYVSKLIMIIFDVYRRFKSALSPERFVLLMQALKTCGFLSSVAKLKEEFLEQQKDITKEQLEKIINVRTRVCLPFSPERFQLKFNGPLMVRNVESAPDPRVDGFYPDRWQRNLLDIIDKKRSVVVVAPTSSGKTFVAYYAIKQILNFNKKVRLANQKKLAVYVAPNKALVNQAAGDIYKRFQNTFGELTDDYANNFWDCEVLITLPRKLEELMMDVAFKDYCSKISVVIIDEVHCVSDWEQGHFYQKIISYLQCQFVALSATIGEPERFRAWLQSLVDKNQKENFEKVELVINSERWSDIEKRVYRPETGSELDLEKDNLLNKRLSKSMKKLHPIVVLALRLTKESQEAFIKDTKLSAEETLSLYETMETVAKENPDEKRLKDFTANFCPESWFSKFIYLTKSEVQNYSKRLLEEFDGWLNECSAGKKVIDVLSSHFVQTSSLEIQQTVYKEVNLVEDFVSLLLSLSSSKMLPCLVFCLDRKLCEKLLLKALEVLEKMESVQIGKEQASAEYKRKLKKEEQARKALKKMRDNEDLLNKRNEEDPYMLEAQEQAAMEPDPNYVDPRFSFVRPGESMASEDLSFWLERAKRKYGWGRSHPMIRAAFRGLGVHHEGLFRGYRHLVETLFRSKHIRVVICTGSLAMGVNMPCRTTVFAGDSEELTPVSYRQMMGRAGRRGYDNTGYVVFYKVPLHKTVALMASKVGEAKQHKIASAVSVLKLTAISPKWLNHSVYLRNKNEKLFFRESLNFLALLGILDKELNPCGLWRVIFHLQEYGSASFVFAILLKNGVFHELSKDFNEQKNGFEKSKNLLILLANLFLRKPIAERNEFKPEATRSKLYLPFLEENILQSLLEYNDLVASCFSESSKINSFKSCVPSCEIEYLNGCPILLNSYIVDFYSVGSYILLQKENGFGEELWQDLKKWSLLLKKLVLTFSEYIPKGVKRNEKDLKVLVKSDDLEDNLLNNMFYLESYYQELFDKIGKETHS